MAVEFRILPGLPGTGPYPVQFSATGRGTHREGLVVQFFPKGSDPWVGNFQPGDTQLSRALSHPDGRTVIVISGGQGYHADPETRSLIRTLSHCIGDAVSSESHGVIALADYTDLYLVRADGRLIGSGRLSWDGIANLAFGDHHVYGLAYDVFGDKWDPIAMNVETGEVLGGAYRIESNKPSMIHLVRRVMRRHQRPITGLVFLLIFILLLTIWRLLNG